MPTNPHFNNFGAGNEKGLVEDLIIESIKMYGEDMWYVPRNINNLDKIYTADDQPSYTTPFMIEMYISSVDGFNGDGNFMSKFGLEIRDQVTFSVAQRSFMAEIGETYGILRPREGDVIYFPLNAKIFQIKDVNKLEMFYQFGGLQTWEMKCELFEYSNEVFDTGIAEIDSIMVRYDTNIIDYAVTEDDGTPILDEDGNYMVTEKFDTENVQAPTSINKPVRETANSSIDWSATNPFGDVI